jgi:hypothetical protein
MITEKVDMTVRSISNETRSRLVSLRRYTRLNFGSIIDDAVDTLWEDYAADGHDLQPELEEFA